MRAIEVLIDDPARSTACDPKHGATEGIREKILTVEAMRSRTALQIEFPGRVVNTLGEEHYRIQVQVFKMPKSKLSIAISKIESGVQKKGGKNKDGGVDRWTRRSRGWSGGSVSSTRSGS